MSLSSRFPARARSPGGRVARGFVVAALLGGTVGEVAWGQAAPGADAAARAASLQEIVVTAEKRASTVQDTPLSITALSGDQLQSQGVSSVAAIAAETPGISMRSAGPGQTELEMRGMASSGGSSPTVGFYLDETPLTPPAASLNGKVVVDPDLFDLSRVEVLRGPQGTLYGAGSMGGTIKLVASQPELNRYAGDIEGIVSGTDGGGINPTLNAMLNVPLVDDKLALRLVGTEKYVDGFIDRVVVQPFPLPVSPCAAYLPGVGCTRGNLFAGTGRQDIPNVNWEWLQSARASLLAKPVDGLTIDTTIMYQRITMGGYSEYDLQPGPNPVLAHYQPFDTPEPFSDTFRLYSTTIGYDLGFATLTSATSYWSREEKQSQDISESLRSDILGYYGLDILTPVLFTENDYSHQFSEEFRVASAGDGDLQWLAGAFYSKLESIFFDINQAPAFAPASVGGAAANPFGIVYDSNNPYHVTQYAVFGEASYQFAETWKLTLGLRWFDYSTHVDEEQVGDLTASGNAIPTIAHFDTSASGFTPKVNLAWQPDPELTVYATAAKGFRPGGVNLPLPPFCQLTQET
jgi:outer membrane receptor protein involved in Fe transport